MRNARARKANGNREQADAGCSRKMTFRESVTVNPRLLRTNSGKPSSASIEAICWLIAASNIVFLGGLCKTVILDDIHKTFDFLQIHTAITLFLQRMDFAGAGSSITQKKADFMGNVQMAQ